MKKFFILASVCVLFLGCATFEVPQAKVPTPEELAQMDYGQPISIDYKATIEAYFDGILVDPYSAHYRYGEPQPFWYRNSYLFSKNQQEFAGYVVTVFVNAKNRMGGYTGEKLYGFIFKNNEVIKIISPEEFRNLAINGGVTFY